MSNSTDPTEAIRQAAVAFPAVDKGTACTQSSFQAGKGKFLFIGPGVKGIGYKAMFKLDESMDQAQTLADEEPARFSEWVSEGFRFTAHLHAQPPRNPNGSGYRLGGGFLRE